jgi:hypothetical protein
MQDSTSDNPLEERPSSDLSITEIGLSARARNVLVDAGLTTVDDVLSALRTGDKALTRLKGFGSKSLSDLKTRLQEHGFSLPEEPVSPLKALEDTLEKELQELEALEAEAVPIEAPPQEAVPELLTVPAAAPVEAVTPQKEAVSEAPSFAQRISATVAQPREQFRLGAWVFAVAGILVILVLLLPPVSLLNRLGITGYMTLDAGDSSVSHADGLTMSVNPEEFGERLRVRIGSVPRLEFLEGSAGSALREAVEGLPSHLVVKSPFYQIKTRGETSQPVMIDVVIPNDAEPWETLDLYTWTGEAWEWVGSELHTEVAEHEFIRAWVTDVPDTLVVVQTEGTGGMVSATWEPDDSPVEAAGGVLDEVNPVGLLLGTDGSFVGDVSSLLRPTGGETYGVLPRVRNWAPGGSVNRGLLLDVLTMPEMRERHVANIVQLCTEWGFGGIDIDYRGVGTEERESYSEFVEVLGEALHEEGLRLSVVVEAPTARDGGWETGGYDWGKLGAVADEVKVPFPEDAEAYVEGGQAQRLLEWATSQVDRYKLRMQVSSLSAERSEGGVRRISLEEALVPFGEVVIVKPSDGGPVEPGSEVELGLSGRLLSVTAQEVAGTYRLEYEGEDGGSRTVWLGTAANLGNKLRWAERYHVGGVAIEGLLDMGNGPGVVEAVASYGSGGASSGGQEIAVVWTVESETATIDQQTAPLTEPGYRWMVLAAEGEYRVKARVGGFDHGAVSIVVGEREPEPEVATVITFTEEITTTETDEQAVLVSEVDSDCLDASYVADVTIPDNTQLDNDEEFVKTWRVSNSGTCAWPENTVLVRIHSQLGGPESVPVGAVEVGEVVEISIDLTAPDTEGVFIGRWVLRVGDVDIPRSGLTVVIRVGEGG